MKHVSGFVSGALGALVLFAALGIFAYWIYAFIYFGLNGSFAGLTERVLTFAPPLARLELRPGAWSEWRTLGYHALRAFGPGVFVLVPLYACLRIYEGLVSN